MPIEFSRTISVKQHGGPDFTVKSLDIGGLDNRSSPVVVMDDFNVRGQPFAPHPHAGFSQITYVFEDSIGALRSRDTLGNDLVIGAGGVVWTQAGSGMMHHEMSADPKLDLHGLQVFVNLSAANKLISPSVLFSRASEIPVWRNERGDAVRVAIGTYNGLVSPVVPVEPFNLLDVDLRHQIEFDVAPAHNTLIYVQDGEAFVGSIDQTTLLTRGQGIAAHGVGQVSLKAVGNAHLIVLSAHEILEPMVTQGPFIMNNQSQIRDALSRYQSGDMGSLSPPDDYRQ